MVVKSGLRGDTIGDNPGVLPFYLGMAGSAVAGYSIAQKKLSSRGQQVVFMGPWSFEQKREFFIGALKPGL